MRSLSAAIAADYPSMLLIYQRVFPEDLDRCAFNFVFWVIQSPGEEVRLELERPFVD